MAWCKNNLNKKPDGFTLIELLVTIAIIGIVTGLVMVRYGSFNSIVLLKNQAFKVALDIREAQVLATSVKGTGSEFRKPYGLHFSTQTPMNGQHYWLFQDTLGTENPPAYNGEVVVSDQYLDSRFVISEICVDATQPCPGASLKDSLTVSFARPDFDAKMRSEDGEVQSARITISAVNDSSSFRSVLISPTGQITVE